MSIATVTSTITVEASTPVIDTSNAEVSGVVTQQQINTLPVNTRQYLNLALLEPGVSQDASRSIRKFKLALSTFFHLRSHFREGQGSETLKREQQL